MRFLINMNISHSEFLECARRGANYVSKGKEDIIKKALHYNLWMQLNYIHTTYTVFSNLIL